jgi:hypothetical protein
MTAGTVTLHVEETTWNNGESLFIGTYTLPNVPGDVTEVTVSIYSPVEPEGDSFFVNGVLVNVDNYDGGCSYTQGYWKTHSIYGPATPADDTWNELPDGPDTEFYLSGATYYDVFWTAPKGNKYYSLAHQFMAAQLNFLNGADPSAAQTAYDAAKLLFETHTPADVKADKDLNKEFGSYIGTLTDYNEGTIGPGHCDDGEEDDDKSVDANIDATSGELLVYPNPMSYYGTLSFIAAENANTTVEVYNLVGTRIDILFNEYVESGSKTNLSIDANKYPKGMYVIYIRNGSSTMKEKLSIMN